MIFGSRRDAPRDRARVSAVAARLRERTLRRSNAEEEKPGDRHARAASEIIPMIGRWAEADARLKRAANPLIGAFAARLFDLPSDAEP